MTGHVLITGGAGFIGSNLCRRLLSEGRRVTVLDNLSRRGAQYNLQALRDGRGDLQVVQGDVRDSNLVETLVAGADEVFHLAAQVAVTGSIADPRHDLEVNLLGTFNVLEAARKSRRSPFVLFTSTNKVYGELAHMPVTVREDRWAFADREHVNEEEPLDFHSPYGCSKGAAEQYVRDYARIYQLPTVVFRMSCIAGPQQMGNEDQGWLAHFLYSILEEREITIYGDGRQARDILHVDDLVNAMVAASRLSERLTGRIFNMGGGPSNARSLLQVLELLSSMYGKTPRVKFAPGRAGDQRIFIADTTAFSRATGWKAKRTLTETIEDIHHWWRQNRACFEASSARLAEAAS